MYVWLCMYDYVCMMHAYMHVCMKMVVAHGGVDAMGIASCLFQTILIPKSSTIAIFYWELQTCSDLFKATRIWKNTQTLVIWWCHRISVWPLVSPPKKRYILPQAPQTRWVGRNIGSSARLAPACSKNVGVWRFPLAANWPRNLVPVTPHKGGDRWMSPVGLWRRKSTKTYHDYNQLKAS